MKNKKFISFAIIICFIISLAAQVFAANDIPDEVFDPATKATKDMPVIEVTRPSNLEEISFKKSFVICGMTTGQNVRVYLLLYNKEYHKKRLFSTLN